MNRDSFTGPSLMEMVRNRVNSTNNYNEDEYVLKNYRPHMDYPYNETSSVTKKSDFMVIKIRPKAELYHNNGNDGWDAHDDIRYRCPTCNRLIGSYRAEIACDQCGTFYDWGDRPARIVVTKSVQWD